MKDLPCTACNNYQPGEIVAGESADVMVGGNCAVKAAEYNTKFKSFSMVYSEKEGTAKCRAYSHIPPEDLW
jgi:hypothetical protein